MTPGLLTILECPYCGWTLQPDDGTPREERNGVLVHGVVYCRCCAYPVIDGIPFIQTGPRAQAALRLLGSGQGRQALITMLGADSVAADSLTPLLDDDPSFTFRAALEMLCKDAEASYLLYRFSDPTYLASKAWLQAVGQNAACWATRALDVGGGAGHLTRTLCAMSRGRDVVLADIAFWKIWLAKRFIAPCCQPVCCDANQPLPFARAAFSFVFSSDAFHYVWTRRLLAFEMMRLVADGGAIVLAHLHNLLVENPSSGMPLDPAGYRRLFDALPNRLVGERALLDAALDGWAIDVSNDVDDGALAAEAALALIATREPRMFRRYAAEAGGDDGQLAINPLYQRERGPSGDLLRRRFPSEYYEAEYAESKRYLPEVVAEADAAAARFVMLPLPQRYA
jgi:uncharacterized protein YbaR (Trm112 family)/SAM-dependent methyltransferase